MRISDWSSDVCSSDLPHHRHQVALPAPAGHRGEARTLPGADPVHRQPQRLRSTMELILLQKVTNLGGLGDKVNVKPCYGRNFLVPQGKAVPATAANLAEFEARRAEYEATAQSQLSEAEQIGRAHV